MTAIFRVDSIRIPHGKALEPQTYSTRIPAPNAVKPAIAVKPTKEYGSLDHHLSVLTRRAAAGFDNQISIGGVR